MKERKVAWIQFTVPIKPSSNAMARAAVVQGDDGLLIHVKLVEGTLHAVLTMPDHHTVTEVPWTNVAAVGYTG